MTLAWITPSSLTSSEINFPREEFVFLLRSTTSYGRRFAQYSFMPTDAQMEEKDSELKDVCSWLRELGFVLDLVKAVVDI